MPGSTGLRVGFIGSGWTDSTQIPTFRLGGLTPQAIASANPAKARAVAEKHGIPEVYATWQELVASPTVDIVSVCTPPHLHKEIAIAALQAGKHVISEKPTALNVAEAEAMLAAAQAAPDQLAIVDHELRFHPQRLQMRQMIREGYIGSVLHVQFDRLGSERLNPNLPWNWWCDVDQGGGILNALGSHLLDLARWMVGRIDALTAQLQIGHLYRTDAAGVVRQVTADDHAQILLRFANGAQGSITVSGLTPGGWGMSIRSWAPTAPCGSTTRTSFGACAAPPIPAGSGKPCACAMRPPTWPTCPTSARLASAPTTWRRCWPCRCRMGEVLLDDAASFYDGLVVQRALDAARAAHQNGEWVKL